MHNYTTVYTIPVHKIEKCTLPSEVPNSRSSSGERPAVSLVQSEVFSQQQIIKKVDWKKGQISSLFSSLLSKHQCPRIPCTRRAGYLLLDSSPVPFASVASMYLPPQLTSVPSQSLLAHGMKPDTPQCRPAPQPFPVTTTTTALQ